MKLFRKGAIDALPVFVGYLSVGFTFGIAAATDWKSSFIPTLASITHISGTGQFVLVSLIGDGSTLAAIIAGIVAINLRYVPMAIAVSQRLEAAMPPWKRLIVAMGDTDEIVGISLRQTPPLRFPYMLGLFVCSWCGWVGGTALGANPATQALLPPRLIAALGIALPAMFAAIVFPAFRESRRIKVAVAVAALASFAMRAVPTGIDPGWITLAAGIGAAALAAVLFPKEPEQGNEQGGEQ